MKIGSSIALIVLGAILSFGVADALEGVDLTLIGYIIMAGGALGLVLSLVLSNRSHTSSTAVRETGSDGNVRDREVKSKTDGGPTLD